MQINTIINKEEYKNKLSFVYSTKLTFANPG